MSEQETQDLQSRRETHLSKIRQLVLQGILGKLERDTQDLSDGAINVNDRSYGSIWGVPNKTSSPEE